jgi:integrase
LDGHFFTRHRDRQCHGAPLLTVPRQQKTAKNLTGASMADRLKLTDAMLQKLKRDRSAGEYLDTLCLGLGVRVSPKGKVTCFFTKKLPGDRTSTRHTLGEWCPPHFTLAHARHKAGEWRALAGQGINPKAEIKKRKAEAERQKDETLEKVIPQWGEAMVRAGRRPHSTEKRIKDLRNHVIPVFGDRHMQEITRSEIKRCLQDIGKDHPCMANRVHEMLSSVFKWAIEEELFGLGNLANPCRGIPYRSYGYVRKARTTLITDEHFAAFPAAIEAAGYPWGQLAHFMFLTAGRHGETIRARWSEIDFEKKIWTAPPEHTKNGLECRRPLSDAAMDVLASLPRNREEVERIMAGQSDWRRGARGAMTGESPWRRNAILKLHDPDRIFGLTVSAKTQWSRVSAKRAFHRHMPEDLRDWMFHSIRHTFRTIMSGHVEDSTVLDKAIELYLGHEEKNVIKATYDHHRYEKAMRKVAEIWAQEVQMRMHPSPKVVPLRKPA